MNGPANDPRVYFAAERTLLAWLRTGLAIIGLGFVVARFSLFLRLSFPHHHGPGYSTSLGVGLVVIGVAANILAAWQHRRFTATLPVADRPAGTMPELAPLFALMVAAAGVLLAVYLAVGPNDVASATPPF